MAALALVPSCRAGVRTALKPASDALFGTAPASGSYNASNDPKLQYDNPLTGGKSFNSLAQQLQIVARLIDASSAAGVQARRQVFFVSMGGFDTHDNQNRNHARLMASWRMRCATSTPRSARWASAMRSPTFSASDFVPHLHQQRRRYRPWLGRATIS